MCMQISHDAKDRYHFAKLALFNVRLLGRLQQEDPTSSVSSIIEDEAKLNGMRETPSLLHQATFLQFSYICLVWLWESAKKENLEQKLLYELPSVTKRLGLEFPKETKGEREIKTWQAVIRLLRNAISHGKVVATDNKFEFSDQTTVGRNRETAPTTLTITWEELALISEAIIYSLTPVLWPTPANPTVQEDIAR